MKTLILALALTAWPQSPDSVYVTALTDWLSMRDSVNDVRLKSALVNLCRAYPDRYRFEDAYDCLFWGVCEKAPGLHRFIFTLPSGRYYEGVCR